MFCLRIAAGAKVEDAKTVNGSIHTEENAVMASVGTVNGSITLGDQSRVQGDVRTVNGSITVCKLSELGKNLVTVNGRISISQSKIEGDVKTVNGDITVGEGSHVDGGILVEKPSSSVVLGDQKNTRIVIDSNTVVISGEQKVPRIVIGANAVVMGELVFEREVELLVHDSA